MEVIIAVVVMLACFIAMYLWGLYQKHKAELSEIELKAAENKIELLNAHIEVLEVKNEVLKRLKGVWDGQ